MKQEDKDLLLKDLCARLPYKPIIQFDGENYDLLALENCEPIFARIIARDYKYSTAESKPLEDIKPYLRPMSNMTEEEKVEYYNTMDKETQRNYPNSCDFSESVYYSNTIKTFDWLNAHHFDYRGLIEKGLAIAITKENNPYED